MHALRNHSLYYASAAQLHGVPNMKPLRRVLRESHSYCTARLPMSFKSGHVKQELA